MADRRIFTLVSVDARQRAVDAVRSAPDGYVVRISQPTRTLEQNALQWTILTAFSRQIRWPIGQQLRYLDPETWKEVLTAAYRRETIQMAQGIYGGFVMVGMSTSDMGRRDFSDWIEFLHSVAADMGVKL